MLKTYVSFFNLLSEFAQTFVLSVSKLLNARCKEWWLAAVGATEERLIAPYYMTQIFYHHILDASQTESDLHLFFDQQKYNNDTLFVTGRFQ